MGSELGAGGVGRLGVCDTPILLFYILRRCAMNGSSGELF